METGNRQKHTWTLFVNTAKGHLNNFIIEQRDSTQVDNLSAAFSAEDYQRTVDFILNYAEGNALVIPGRAPGFKTADPRTRLLPASMNKTKLFKMYRASLRSLRDPDGKEYRIMGRTSFINAWKQYCPFVLTTKPKTYLCWTCEKMQKKVYEVKNTSPDIKQAKLDEYNEHLRHVEQERNVFRAEVAEAKSSIENNPANAGPFDASSRNGSMHYSFDFAQQIHYPNDPDQPGPTYFLTCRKCGVFGIHCEGNTKQVNYLIDEGVECGKGSNSVISCLDYYFDYYGLGEQNALLRCDNCSGQNKNRSMMAYLAWGCLHGYHASIEIKFLVAGHTKFSPDWCFGLFKQSYRRSHVSCVQDISDVCTKSSSSPINIPLIVRDERGNVFVEKRDWKEFLKSFFKAVPNIKSLHHLQFNKKHPGMVFTKTFADAEEHQYQILKDVSVIPPNIRPKAVKPEGH